jgi:hypothetical protein
MQTKYNLPHKNTGGNRALMRQVSRLAGERNKIN